MKQRDKFIEGQNTVLLYKATFQGSYVVSEYLDDVTEVVKNEVHEMDEGEKIVITRVRMSQKKYEKLSDFSGFN